MKKSCPHIWIRHVTHRNTSCHAHESVMSLSQQHQHAACHSRTSCLQQAATLAKSRHTYEWVMSHVWISHVTHNMSCHTHESVMSLYQQHRHAGRRSPATCLQQAAALARPSPPWAPETAAVPPPRWRNSSKVSLLAISHRKLRSKQNDSRAAFWEGQKCPVSCLIYWLLRLIHIWETIEDKWL